MYQSWNNQAMIPLWNGRRCWPRRPHSDVCLPCQREGTAARLQRPSSVRRTSPCGAGAVARPQWPSGAKRHPPLTGKALLPGVKGPSGGIQQATQHSKRQPHDQLIPPRPEEDAVSSCWPRRPRGTMRALPCNREADSGWPRRLHKASPPRGRLLPQASKATQRRARSSA